METIVCKTCGEAKEESDFHCIGAFKAPALCKLCFKKRRKEYLQRPEVRARTKERNKDYMSRPDYKIKRKQYRLRPEVKEREKSYAKRHMEIPEVKERNRFIKSQYRKKTDTIKKVKAYNKRPEVKERKYGHYKRYVTEARASYVKTLIKKKTNGILRPDSIPPILIEMQQQSLILKRAIKQKQDEQSNNTTDV